MNSVQNKLRKKKAELSNPQGMFKNEAGAIDLASIMVGIIVIGLIGGVIAATVFAIIPWSQDNAAKQQLDSIVAAESAYIGLSSAVPSPLPAGSPTNSFGNSAELKTAGLLNTGTTYCATTPVGGKNYTAFSKSASGKIWSATDQNTKPVIYAGTLPTDCQFIGEVSSGPGDGTAAYVDPTPTRTTFTYRCDTNVAAGALPFGGTIKGTETWSDGLVKNVNASWTTARSFTAGVTYKVDFDGTYGSIIRNQSNESMALQPCLRSVDHLGSATGVTNLAQAFSQASNLTSVPDHLPSTVKTLSYAFWGSPNINDSNISKWDVSNVTLMDNMFSGATKFNQPLNDWNVSSLTVTTGMFVNATSFNQPLNKWNVSNVQNMTSMFAGATSFNQDLSGWNTVKVGSGTNFAPNTFPTEYLPPKTTKAP